MKHNHLQHKGSAFKTLTGFAILGGALYGLTIAPAFSQTTPPAPPADGPQKSEVRPIPGTPEVDAAGRLIEPRGDRDGKDAPPARGPRGERGPRDDRGPRGERGPRDDRGPGEKRGPRDGEGPGRGGRDMRGPGEERGPRDGEGPRKGGPRDGEGPRRGGDIDERGPRGERGPRDERGPRGERGPGAERGPRDGEGPRRGGPGGPRGERGPEGAMERAYRGAGELERYGQLQGDVFNLTGQARDYYNRAGVALKAGNSAEAEKLARTSDQLTRAALHLARAENGPLPVPTVVGWSAPPTPKAPTPPVDDEREPRVLEDLNRRLQDVKTTPDNASWIETARRLSTEAQKDMTANRSEAGRERAMAAMTLLEAADAPRGDDAPAPPQPR
jgi:hypothetical protein